MSQFYNTKQYSKEFVILSSFFLMQTNKWKYYINGSFIQRTILIKVYFNSKNCLDFELLKINNIYLSKNARFLVYIRVNRVQPVFHFH